MPNIDAYEHVIEPEHQLSAIERLQYIPVTSIFTLGLCLLIDSEQ